jgi:hypothetical protein
MHAGSMHAHQGSMGMGGAPVGSLGGRVGGPGGMVGSPGGMVCSPGGMVCGPVMIGPAPMSGPVLGPMSGSKSGAMSGPVCAPVGMPAGVPFGYEGTDSWGAVAGGLWPCGAPPSKSCEQQAWEEQLKVQPPLRPRHRGLSFGPGDKVHTSKSDPLTGRPMFRCNGMSGQCRECRPLTESGAWAKHNLTQEELTALGLGAKRYCGECKIPISSPEISGSRGDCGECKIPISGSRGDASRADAGGGAQDGASPGKDVELNGEKPGDDISGDEIDTCKVAS